MSGRLRRTPFSKGVLAAGVKGYTVYNHTLLATVFHSLQEDYRHLKSFVQIWDVSCQRQVAVQGTDATHLVQLLTPRDLSRIAPKQCCYIPVVDEQGKMLNDPVALKHSDDHWWLSLADSDLLFWVKGLAVGRNIQARVYEPDIAPLAVQGPKADELMEHVFGEKIHAVKFFRFETFSFLDIPIVISRSGYSKQGGFEVFVPGIDIAMPLWNALLEAGKSLNVRVGCPNLIERIEGGLLSYGNDIGNENSPLESGLGRYCNLSSKVPCMGHDALIEEALCGPSRQIRPLAIDGPVAPVCDRPWSIKFQGKYAGKVTSATWSPDFDTNVAIAMVEMEFAEVDTRLEVEVPDGVRPAAVRSSFWL
ncbi:MAG: dimethylsulfoniopropionate demethylase [Aestuariivita sp.]|nr:dimethylsulfoniopropionate demethylase [Aestuariivita sp.]MCY4201120.1 dimethylsulfoniopropionate demethylase [Aestuariivita sp.]MCY4288306.1 dimethylsulfoniopropionate demethylase [Aestuariivita sp.]MCY4345950.1 dimethylsulfoniopropionate demethylase [Aestuariivita sp.]